MKHIIIFLGYTQSRIDNPVYRLFATESLARRNFALLFLGRSIEERDLLHEAASLRRHDNNEDITFHICIDIRQDGQADSLIATARLVRSHFQTGGDNTYPIFAYGLMPANVADESAASIKTVWHNLVALNRSASEYPNQSLIRTVMLYSDQSQSSLAQYLFYTTRADLGNDFLSIRNSSADSHFPPVFGTFNATGISYPDNQIRAYMHQCYMLAALRVGIAADGSVPMQQCQAEANRILSSLPLRNEQLCLQQSSGELLPANDSNKSEILLAADYWTSAIPLSPAELKDIPHGDWLLKTRQRADLLYQGKFRGMGVDLYFAVQNKKTEQYARTLSDIVSHALEAAVRSTPYTIEAIQYIIYAITNLLQQKVAELQTLRSDVTRRAEECRLRVSDIEKRWMSLGIIGRMRGRDKELLEDYHATLSSLETALTWQTGCEFAIKLLNELIPCIAVLEGRYVNLRRLLSDAVAEVNQLVADSQPKEEMGIFDYADVERACAMLASDSEQVQRQYLEIVNCYLDTSAAAEVASLAPLVRSSLFAAADDYLDTKIAAGEMPPVIDFDIVKRIDRMRSAEGGVYYFVQDLVRQTPVNLQLKDGVTSSDAKPTDEYVLLTPSAIPSLKMRQVVTSATDCLRLVHVLYGVTLEDLEGFAGQQMFIEPSLF